MPIYIYIYIYILIPHSRLIELFRIEFAQKGLKTNAKKEAKGLPPVDFAGILESVVRKVATFMKEAMVRSPLRRPEFALLCLANFFGDFTQYLPYIYLPDMMGTVGISSSDASFSIAIMGFSNMIGRIASGVVLDCPFVNSFAFICLSFVCSGM